MGRAEPLREYVRGSLLVLPVVMAAVAVVAGLLIAQIPLDPQSPVAFQGTADDARILLGSIAGTMVTVIALLLGLGVVALQLSSTQFSPRLLRNFLRDRTIQIALGVFVATFAYSAAGLFTVGVEEGRRVDDFPRLAVSVAIALLFVSLGLLIYFADHLAHSIQVDSIMRMIERETLLVIADCEDGNGTSPAMPADAQALTSPRSGYVQTVAYSRLLQAAAQQGYDVWVRPIIGEHVVAGTVLAWVRPVDGAHPDQVPAPLVAAVQRSIRLGFERTLEQDVGFGLRRLLDIACRALSAAINDPYTAIQAIDHLAVLYTRLSARPLGDHVQRDAATGVTVVVPARRYEDYLGIGMGLIRRHGGHEPTVAQAQLRLLTCCAAVLESDERAAAVREEARLVVAEATRGTAEPRDLDVVHQEASTLELVLASRHRPRPKSPPDL